MHGFSARICFAITGTFNEIVVFGITLPQEIVFILGVTKRNLGPWIQSMHVTLYMSMSFLSY